MNNSSIPTEFVLYKALFCDIAEIASFFSEDAAYRAYESLKGDSPVDFEYGILMRKDFDTYAKMLREGSILS